MYLIDPKELTEIFENLKKKDTQNQSINILEE